VHEHVLGVVLLVEKDARVSATVPARPPCGILLPVADLTPAVHGLHVRVAELDALGKLTANVRVDSSRVVPMKRDVQRGGAAMALLTTNTSMAGPVPLVIDGLHLVATRAPLAAA